MKKTAPIILLIALFGAAAWYSFVKAPEPVSELPPPQLAPVAPVVESEPMAALPPQDLEGYMVDEPAIEPDPLPLLNDSDTELTAALADTVGSEVLAEYLVKDQLISRFVAAVDSLTSRQVPAPINPVKAADGKFMAHADGASMVMSAQNFSRYDGYVALLQNLDSDTVLAVYHRYAPLFQQAWEENGGEGAFGDRLVHVIDHLLETPDVPGPVYLTKPEAVYLFADPALEAMTAGEKTLIRMGSANAAVVKEKLAELKAGLVH